MNPANFQSRLRFAALLFSAPMVMWASDAAVTNLVAYAAKDVDLRPALERWGLAPREQGSRPTCSVFAFAGALEFAVARERQQGERLSVEFLNWSANQVQQQNADGGFFSDLWNGFSQHGICAEAAMPYRAKFEPTRLPGEEVVSQARRALSLGLQLHWLKEWNVNTGLTAAELAAIKTTLYQGWPVCGGFRWPKQEVWKAGVLQLCPPAEVFDGHSVLLVGYQDDAQQPGGGVFIFLNSGGTGRIGLMPYAYAQSYLNDAAWIEAGTKSKSPQQ